jgi:alkylation response protein AidB-like acyl-CoA dehydrogenase
MMRDARINLIIEGTSQIMRLFIAREALDAHMRIVGELLSPHRSTTARLQAALIAGSRYAAWYPRLWLAWGGWPRFAAFGPELVPHMRFIERASRHLARALFHGAVRHQTRLAARQQLLGRLVDIGAELFAMIAACAKARAMIQAHPSARSPVQLADLFCRLARRRIAGHFDRLHDNDDQRLSRLAQEVLNGQLGWLEAGIVNAASRT